MSSNPRRSSAVPGAAPDLRHLAYRGRGTTGVPLVLIHGFPLDHTMWAGQLDGLGGFARVVALDLPGFGASPHAGVDPLGMDEMSDAVLAVADALGFERFVACGLSMGGYVAMALARRRPERLLGVALCNTRAEPDSPEARKVRAHDAARVLAEGVGFLIERQLHNLLSAETLARRRDLAVAVETMIRRASPQGVAAALRGMAQRPDSRPTLAELDVPAVVVAGSEDAIVAPASAKDMASRIRGCELAVVPGAGHLAPFEAPDAVNAALRKLLRRVAKDEAARRKKETTKDRELRGAAAREGHAPADFDNEPTFTEPPRPRRGPGLAR